MRKPQEKSRFAVPVAVAVAAHAFLFFGFAPPTVVIPPPATGNVSPPKDPSPPVVVDLAKPDVDPNAVEPSSPRQASAVPTQPDSIPDVVPATAITVPVAVTPSGPTPATTNVIPTGLPGIKIGDGIGPGRISILHGGDLDNVPRVTFQARPNYPFTLRERGVSGEVVVDFMVDEQGRVSDVRVIRSTDSEFEPPTVAAVEKWRFEPGKRHGRVVRFRMSQAVSFAVGN